MIEKEILNDATSYRQQLDANQEEENMPVVDIKKDRRTKY